MRKRDRCPFQTQGTMRTLSAFKQAQRALATLKATVSVVHCLKRVGTFSF